MPFLTGYTLRKAITIDHTYVDSNLTDFPLLVKFTDDAAIGANIDTNGYNIRFTSSDGETLLKYERQSFDNGGSTATGIFWVKVPTVSGASNTTIYIYYKSAAPSDGADATNVWDSNFAAIYHMEQDPSGGSGAILDSTANNYDGTSGGSMTSGDLVSGQVGSGIDFDGSNDYITFGIGSHSGFSSGFTVEAWAKGTSAGGAIITSGYDNIYQTDTRPWFLIRSNLGTGAIDFFLRDTAANNFIAASGNNVLDDSTWRHIAGRYNESSSRIDLFVDGVSVANAVSVSNESYGTGWPLVIGSHGGGFL